MLGVTLPLLTVGAGVIMTTVAMANDPGSPMNNMFARVAEILNIEEDTLTSAFTQASFEKIDQAVLDGNLSEEKAVEIKENIENGNFRFEKGLSRLNRRMNIARKHVQDLADYLEVEENEIIDQLKEGKTVAEVVEGYGKDLDVVKDYIVDKAIEKIIEAVDQGKITEEKADEILENLDSRIDSFLYEKRLPKEPGEGGGEFKDMMNLNG